MPNNVYPRVFDCLYSWCPARRPECARCDAVEAARSRDFQQDEHVRDLRAEQQSRNP